MRRHAPACAGMRRHALDGARASSIASPITHASSIELANRLI